MVVFDWLIDYLLSTCGCQTRATYGRGNFFWAFFFCMTGLLISTSSECQSCFAIPEVRFIFALYLRHGFVQIGMQFFSQK